LEKELEALLKSFGQNAKPGRAQEIKRKHIEEISSQLDDAVSERDALIAQVPSSDESAERSFRMLAKEIKTRLSDMSEIARYELFKVAGVQARFLMIESRLALAMELRDRAGVLVASGVMKLDNLPERYSRPAAQRGKKKSAT
jgi:hypothetical protein